MISAGDNSSLVAWTSASTPTYEAIEPFDAFSNKQENFEGAVALHFAAYNFVRRIHRCGRLQRWRLASRKPWGYGDLVEMAG
jgi:hypothetical protein